MSIILKTDKEIEKMHEAGKAHARLMSIVRDAIKPDVSTLELDDIATKTVTELGVKAEQVGYRGYQHVLCVGINDDGLHCIPSEKKIIKNGDIVSIDSVISKNGYMVDAGFSMGVGDVNEAGERLLAVGKMALDTAVKTCVVGNKTGDISHAIYTIAKVSGFDVITEYAGHGVGKQMHEYPQVLNRGEKGTGVDLEKGMTLALDVLITEGVGEIIHLDDGWSTRTKDGKRFVFFEHTVAVTEHEPLVLTQ